jgi:hypothetical protein
LHVFAGAAQIMRRACKHMQPATCVSASGQRRHSYWLGHEHVSVPRHRSPENTLWFLIIVFVANERSPQLGICKLMIY